MSVEVGSTVKATVVRVADYGAIVRLDGGQTGLIHISEIVDAYVRDVREYLSESDEVTVKVLRLNSKGRYELSIKQCESNSEAGSLSATGARPVGISRGQERWDARGNDSSHSRSPVTFEDRLSRFLKDSEEKQHDLKRHNDARRGRK